jgi:hypothetical protein
MNDWNYNANCTLNISSSFRLSAYFCCTECTYLKMIIKQCSTYEEYHHNQLLTEYIQHSSL